MAVEGYQCCEVSGAPHMPLPVRESWPSFAMSAAGDAGRSEVEAYIAARFADAYGARVRNFLPLLLSQRQGCSIHAALGMRRADSGPLFLEQYLDQPVEQLLATAGGRPVARTDIVEIGNLVSTSRGSSRLLFLMLAELFAAAGITWAIFTATPEVRSLLQKLTGNQLVLCMADGERLGADLADWGSYYETRPAVTAINVAEERAALLERPLIRPLLLGCTSQARAMAPAFAAMCSGGESCN
ncbi:thermostable hemolysin [Microbulbifer magnicolonia]|uniref:thermostable hemolysin n=1 Tax=Microbulbifer magnicolonia TaxID=3109744 RepID=UPI002B40FA65|nr:thermostable hemolysin [Microbulbifer sp. GG15]